MGEATLVIGAGAAGLTAAYELARRGLPVRVIDREGGPGPHGCSWWAGGMLAPGCEGETAEARIVAAGRGAADWWAGVTQVWRAGSLVVAPGRDRVELDRFAQRTSGWEWLDAEGIAALEPDLAGRFDRALFFADEAHLDPRRALADLVAALAGLGVSVERAEAEPAGAALDCRGLAARGALPGLRGVRGAMAVLRSAEITLRRPVRLLHPRHPLYVVPRGDGRLMLGATQIESDARGPVTARALLELLSAAYALHPALAEAAVVETGADARPAFADNAPRVVRAGSGLRLNGLFRHGFLLAPALARTAADFIESGRKGDFLHED
ncbi:MAG: FAD-dependent oxidoreductase [Rubrimonas sp.]